MLGDQNQKSSMELIVPITVEFEEVDSFRIVHHSKLVAYLERARLRLLRDLGMDTRLFGLAPVVYDLSIRFRKPARLLDQLEVTVQIKDFDEYQLILASKIRRDGETLVRATVIVAFADLDDGTLCPIPQDLLLQVENFCGKN